MIATLHPTILISILELVIVKWSPIKTCTHMYHFSKLGVDVLCLYNDHWILFSPHWVGKNERGEAKKRLSNSLQLFNFKVLALYTFMNGNKGFGSLQFIGGNKIFGSLQFIGGNKGFGSLQFIGGNKGFGSLMVTNNLSLSHSFMVNKEESPNLFFPLAKEILIYVALIIMADKFSSLSLSLSLAPARWIII